MLHVMQYADQCIPRMDQADSERKTRAEAAMRSVKWVVVLPQNRTKNTSEMFIPSPIIQTGSRMLSSSAIKNCDPVCDSTSCSSLWLCSCVPLDRGVSLSPAPARLPCWLERLSWHELRLITPYTVIATPNIKLADSCNVCPVQWVEVGCVITDRALTLSVLSLHTRKKKMKQ